MINILRVMKILRAVLFMHAAGGAEGQGRLGEDQRGATHADAGAVHAGDDETPRTRCEGPDAHAGGKKQGL